MSAGRMHVKVNNSEVWRRLHFSDNYWKSIGMYPEECNFIELADKNETSFVIPEGEIDIYSLKKLANKFAKKIGEDGIVIADVTYQNLDPITDCIFYLGDHVRQEQFGMFSERAVMANRTAIEDILSWLNYGRFRVNNREKQVLLKNGILYANGQFMAFSQNLGSMDKIYLRETSFEGRPEIIEKTIVGEEVYFVNSKNSYGLEVMSELGSLGTLPSDVSDQLSGLIEEQYIKYTAVVSEVIPASKRNKHVKSSIVVINIDAQFSDMKVPKKTSVPKVNRDEQLLNIKKEEARKAEAERKRKEEAHKAEAERKRKEEEARKAEAERKRKEEAHKAEAERKRKEEEARKAEAERKRKEEEARKAEAERKRKEEEARKAEAERKRKEKEAHKREYERQLKEYQEDYKIWKHSYSQAIKDREKAVETKLSEEKSRLENEMNQKYESALASLNDKKDQLMKIKETAEVELAGLGIFSFKKKKEKQIEIDNRNKEISLINEEIINLDNNHKAEMKRLSELLPELKKT